MKVTRARELKKRRRLEERLKMPKKAPSLKKWLLIAVCWLIGIIAIMSFAVLGSLPPTTNSTLPQDKVELFEIKLK